LRDDGGRLGGGSGSGAQGRMGAEAPPPVACLRATRRRSAADGAVSKSTQGRRHGRNGATRTTRAENNHKQTTTKKAEERKQWQQSTAQGLLEWAARGGHAPWQCRMRKGAAAAAAEVGWQTDEGRARCLSDARGSFEWRGRVHGHAMQHVAAVDERANPHQSIIIRYAVSTTFCAYSCIAS
jgi:hypothetical protein